MKQTLAEIAKAITSALLAFYAFYMKDSSGGVSVDEWVEIAVYTAVAFVGVWLIPNGGSVSLGSLTTVKGGVNGTETRTADTTDIHS